MNRFRNPKFAPEILERKLSPSSIVAIPAPSNPGSSAYYAPSNMNPAVKTSETVTYDVPKDPPPPPPIDPVRITKR